MNLKLVDACYEVVYDGYQVETPLLHLCCRRVDSRFEHVVIDDFRPYFCITREELRAVEPGRLESDDRILDVVFVDEQHRPEMGLHDEPLARIICTVPWHVSDLRADYTDHHEADVPFTERFLVDMDIRQWMTVDTEQATRDARGRLSVSHSAVEGLSERGTDHETGGVRPRICFFDIEVQQSDSGPSVVSKEGTEAATQPITAITAYDSYIGDYQTWVLGHGAWDVGDIQAAHDVYESGEYRGGCTVLPNATDVCGAFCGYVDEREMDVLTAWNAPFDVPYTINFGLQHEVPAVSNLSRVGELDEVDGEGRFVNRDVQGRVVFDLLTGYEKSRVHSLDSNRLADVAANVCDSIGKLDVPDIDETWRTDPAQFVRYNVRDVEAIVQINQQANEGVTII